VADILHDFPIAAPPRRVFEAVSSPAGLDQWWTKTSDGKARVGAEYELGFGPDFDWRARVSACTPDRQFELEMTRADSDWSGTRVRFELEETGGGTGTQLRFRHVGWPAANEHYRISCFCWAMYLRVLRRFIEHGEEVPYERRLDV
jgi:uncharacterized protein YndB with AHSA1/START domain